MKQRPGAMWGVGEKTFRPVPFSWDHFVDLVSVIWLGLFFWGVADPNTIVPDALDVALISVFIVDVVFKLRVQPTWRDALRNHWFEFLLVIPDIRIFRILRFTRVLRLMKTFRITKLRRYPGHQKALAFVKKMKRVTGRVRMRWL